MNQPSLIETTDSQTLLNQIVMEYLQEQKRKRRWRWVKRIIILLILAFLLYQFLSLRKEQLIVQTKPHIGLIDIEGAIDAGQNESAENFVKSLSQAYKNKSLKAIILRINSPGGSPVQADYMFSNLQYFRKQHPEVKVYAVCGDICASAAYYVAAGAEEIYANPASMVGSIGVIYNGFGFVDLMQKVGVSRRLQTAGTNKGFLDPFSPSQPEQQQILQTMLNEVHQQFIARVKEGRGSRLKIDQNTFSGLIWTGEQARVQGLIDGFASSGQLAREVIKIDKMVNYTHRPSVIERFAKNMGTAAANQLPLALGLQQGFS